MRRFLIGIVSSKEGAEVYKKSFPFNNFATHNHIILLSPGTLAGYLIYADDASLPVRQRAVTHLRAVNRPDVTDHLSLLQDFY